jgi:hypothetical protein
MNFATCCSVLPLLFSCCRCCCMSLAAVPDTGRAPAAAARSAVARACPCTHTQQQQQQSAIFRETPCTGRAPAAALACPCTHITGAAAVDVWSEMLLQAQSEDAQHTMGQGIMGAQATAAGSAVARACPCDTQQHEVLMHLLEWVTP